MTRLFAISVVCVFLASGPVLAAGSSDPPAPKDMAEMVQAREHVQANRFNEAVPLLKKVVAAEPQNADAWNLLAFSQRKMDDLQDSLANYRKALEIDPDHKDAHEYLGELFLRMGDLKSAEQHLKRLDSICMFGCKQFDQLKAAIAEYKKQKGLS